MLIPCKGQIAAPLFAMTAKKTIPIVVWFLQRFCGMSQRLRVCRLLLLTSGSLASAILACNFERDYSNDRCG
ncbi:hypothetical protein L596_027076 [Steinernema carpocapsae]|uniref:Uncharacterized protein n=1 Tax=Steinernema carpocapsae TaxID=34508 RepID=A0A4U5M3A4_STECR|nr:hypothetical protein L596_027076 [Steinernema carpocapsae]